MPRYYEQQNIPHGGPPPPRNSRSARDNHRRGQSRRYPSDFTYISNWVKYSMFFLNLLLCILGALMIAAGLYAVFDKWKSGEGFKLETVFDILFNLAFLVLILGIIVFLVSFTGFIGALRENLCFLHFYSFCLLLFFLAELALAALGFIYPHKVSYFMEESLSDQLIKSYRDDLDFQNLIDLVQKEFECCGISSEGFRDWSKNEYFNCTKNPKDNPSVERCGVPYSCCLSSANSLSETNLVNIMCGFGVQEMRQTEVLNKIHTQGCIESVQRFVQMNLHIVGGVAIIVAITQLLVIWLARTLEGQIESQRSLWHY